MTREIGRSRIAWLIARSFSSSRWLVASSSSRMRGAAIERARQHDALHLPARKRAAHIAHQRLVAHRHAQDLFVDGGELRHLLDPLRVGRRAEAGDVLGDRAGEQPIVLQHAADLRAIRVEPDGLQRHIIDQHRAGGRAQQTCEDLEQCRLARAGRPGDRDAFAGRDIEVEIGDHPRARCRCSGS